jgi:hypothetical protein
MPSLSDHRIAVGVFLSVLAIVIASVVVLAVVLIVASTGGWSTTLGLAANRFAATASPADGLLLQPGRPGHVRDHGDRIASCARTRSPVSWPPRTAARYAWP